MDTLYTTGIIYFIASMVDERGIDQIRPRFESNYNPSVIN